VFVGQLPPPVHGAAVMNLAMVSGDYHEIQLEVVPIRFSSEVSDVGRFRPGKLLRIPSLIWAVMQARRRTRAEVLVYTVGAQSQVGVVRDVMVLPIIRRFFRRTVFFVHTGGIRRIYDRRPLSWFARFAYGGADLVIHIDPLVAGPDDQLPKPKKIAYLPLGIRDVFTERQRATAQHRPVILFVGNLYPSKGTHCLVRAAAHLAARHEDFELRFVGASPTGSTEPELLDLAHAHGVADRVSIVGALPPEGVQEELRAADIFCFPTHYEAEAWPVVIAEAMAAGLPVVSTTWRAVPALVRDGVTGFLVDPDDDLALAERLAALLDAPELRRAMGDAARAAFEQNYTLERFQSRFEELIAGAAK
jgi:glycosyltransferase involved in cell wall biosynthesis